MAEPNPRPLPESLTRFLAAPTAPIIEPAVGKRMMVSAAPPHRPNLALKIAIAWAVCFNVAGAGILYWLYSTMGV